MGESKQRIAASSCHGENNGLGSREAHHVSRSPEEDRSGTAGEVGKV
jgi:hypothetical protein